MACSLCILNCAPLRTICGGDGRSLFNNQITRVDAGAFNGLTNLTQLYVFHFFLCGTMVVRLGMQLPLFDALTLLETIEWHAHFVP